MIELVAQAWDWSESHRWVVWAAASVSLGSLVLSGWFVRMVVLRLPPDHYSLSLGTRAGPPTRRRAGLGLVSRVTGAAMAVGRNVLGWVLVAAGLAMLALPGQGILSILAGLVLVDFPGKRRLERRLLAIRVVREGMNWLRRRAGRPPFDFT